MSQFIEVVELILWSVTLQDTSIRLMMLWQVLRLRPSNLISFPENKGLQQ